jgi:cytochrome bd-type quinol oxidase subunit 2
MRTQQVNRVSSVVLILLSLTALVTVVTGLIWPPPMPESDEGTQAHIFQLSIAALFPVSILVLGTADWRRAWRSVRPLVISSAATALAFAGLYYLRALPLAPLMNSGESLVRTAVDA